MTKDDLAEILAKSIERPDRPGHILLAVIQNPRDETRLKWVFFQVARLCRKEGTPAAVIWEYAPHAGVGLLALHLLTNLIETPYIGLIPSNDNETDHTVQSWSDPSAVLTTYQRPDESTQVYLELTRFLAGAHKSLPSTEPPVPSPILPNMPKPLHKRLATQSLFRRKPETIGEEAALLKTNHVALSHIQPRSPRLGTRVALFYVLLLGALSALAFGVWTLAMRFFAGAIPGF